MESSPTTTSTMEQPKQRFEVFLSRVPTKFDEDSIQRLLEERLGIERVLAVNLVHPKLTQKDDDDASDNNKEETQHLGYGFVSMKSQEICDKAIALKKVRGTANPRSKKKYTFYIGKVVDDAANLKTCFLWEQNRCPYGDDCKFSHAGPGGLLPPRDDAAAKAKKKKKCRDHRKGMCQLGDACPFSHEFQPNKPGPRPDSEKDCIKWKTLGKCTRRDRCPYRHDEAVREAALAKKKGKQQSTQKQKRPLWARVFGLSYETPESAVREFFADCGPIVKIEFPTFSDSGRSKGYCGILFQSPVAVDKAVELDGQELHGRWLSVQAGRMYLEQWEEHHRKRQKTQEE